MLALRRAANITRSPSTHRFVARAFCANLGVKNSNLKHFTERASHTDRGHASTNHFPCGRSATCLAIRNLCSQSGANTDNEGNKQLLIEQEIPDDESEADEAEAVDNVLRVSNDETDFSISKKFEGKYLKPPLFKVIMEASWESLSTVLNIWVEEGNSLGRDEISVALHGLRKRQLYGKALQFVEWLETTKRLNFVDHDYAYHLDLIAKVHGVEKAERYIRRIPESFKTEAIYEALLTNYVSTNNIKKAEEVFNKIRDLSLPVTIFSCNRLLLLYKRHRRNKIADLLTMMEKENVKPSLFTYKLLIDLKGRSHDIAGMENIIETMKMNGVEPDVAARALVASHYIVGGLNDKAEKTLKEMEGEADSNNRNAFKSLLPLYAALGRADDVKRIWKLCEENPTLDEFSAVIEAWGKLGHVEEVENAFVTMLKRHKKVSSVYYNVLLNVYANHKLLTKGKELAKRMGENGCRIGPLTWDALVKLYVKAGEVEKAESILQKVVQGKKGRPLYGSYVTILEEYAKRGDIHNSEKIFRCMKMMDYLGGMAQYKLLLEAYKKAEKPAYGFRERMRSDNMYPGKQMLTQLEEVDAFKKRYISESIG
ncbi:pentatricopeptide repeat-containing protein At1g80270, mitochondrial-like isoform X3 [Ananas comosus]|uniref:Pentatricopeptide repeat-containing protein At1g80270, mitochondrial-like isoform X3 n=1 Tax=Ananas comosus TaxID=4615 RepID=A0A6P5FY29_ANACO|nr:pentatricopeptide repeat-containing protein At1g80270, mitochondrial-like isoform X3 [Ananas comosus]